VKCFVISTEAKAQKAKRSGEIYPWKWARSRW